MAKVEFPGPNSAQVEAWIARLDQLGVRHAELLHTPITGSYLVVFRDPDNIQLEMYTPG